MLAKRDNVYALQEAMQQLPQSEPVTEHHWAAGVYARTMHLRATELVVGKKHRFPCINFISQGSVQVVNVADEEDSVRYTAPAIFVSPAGTKRAIYAHEDACWTTVHASEETDLDKLEQQFIEDDS